MCARRFTLLAAPCLYSNMETRIVFHNDDEHGAAKKNTHPQFAYCALLTRHTTPTEREIERTVQKIFHVFKRRNGVHVGSVRSVGFDCPYRF